jgi:hypothetical protein
VKANWPNVTIPGNSSLKCTQILLRVHHGRSVTLDLPAVDGSHYGNLLITAMMRTPRQCRHRRTSFGILDVSSTCFGFWLLPKRCAAAQGFQAQPPPPPAPARSLCRVSCCRARRCCFFFLPVAAATFVLPLPLPPHPWYTPHRPPAVVLDTARPRESKMEAAKEVTSSILRSFAFCSFQCRPLTQKVLCTCPR